MDVDSVRIFAKGWNFSQDGPGNRLIYHLQGCNFLCPWCSNPEGIAMKGAGRSCREYTIAEIIEEIESSRPFFHDGGGVTITGGEPTLQFRALKTLLGRIKNSSVHLAMETNGTHHRLSETFDLLDLLIMDLKHYDPDLHRRRIGADNRETLNNLRKATDAGMELWVRIPLIAGFNDGSGHIGRFIDTIKECNNDHVSVELLRYHEYGKIKWEQLGMRYEMDGGHIAADDFERYRQMFIDNGIRIINT
jgi:pyruvate formate lyase activating enzyme